MRPEPVKTGRCDTDTVKKKLLVGLQVAVETGAGLAAATLAGAFARDVPTMMGGSRHPASRRGCWWSAPRWPDC